MLKNKYNKNIKINFNNFNHLIATGFGIGILPMSGTWGALLAIPLWYILKFFSYYIYLFLFFSCVGTFCCYKFTQDINIHDHSYIVFDEILGMFVLIELLKNESLLVIFLGFLFFRILDIYKPWPISYFDMKTNIFFVILDDLIASIISYFIIILLKTN